jgi:hypothetical protein
MSAWITQQDLPQKKERRFYLFPILLLLLCINLTENSAEWMTDMPNEIFGCNWQILIKLTDNYFLKNI